MTNSTRTIINLIRKIDSHNSMINYDGICDDGSLVGFEKSVKSILWHVDSLLDQNERLREENERLKSENYKDEELIAMKKTYDLMRGDLMRGFPISEEEAERIRKWKEEHLRKCHPRAMKDPSYFGCIGGNFTYSFIPTSIGVIGTVKCSCGEEFDFTEEL